MADLNKSEQDELTAPDTDESGAQDTPAEPYPEEIVSDDIAAGDIIPEAPAPEDFLPQDDTYYDEEPVSEESYLGETTPQGNGGKAVLNMMHERSQGSEAEIRARERREAAKKAGKKAAKKNKRPLTVEEQLRDLAQEEKEFDEWGRKIRKKKRRKGPKSRLLSCTLVLLTLIVASSSVLSVAILAIAKEIYGIDKSSDKRAINIPEGSTSISIAEQLQANHMITMPQMFRIISRLKGKDGDFIAGDHELTASMSYEDMIEELCTNHADERETQRVVFREGITLLDAAKTLQEHDICKADDFLFYFNAGGFDFEFENHLPTNKNPLKFQRMEGYCFPDTYEFYVHEDPSIVAQKIYANFNSKLTEGDYRKMDELGMTLDEVITLASIVQGEAPDMASMKNVASIFHNRLNNSSIFPMLQSDPTRKYAEDVIAPNLQIANDLMCNAYNTYKGQGLPPGAINNPGREAIEAVLYPADTPYFYFNANIDTKQIYYAITYEEHLANLAEVDRQYAEANANANG